MITVNEVAKITGNTTLEESASNAYYYFDSNNESPSATCTTGNTTVCNYGWLYDRTKADCELYGCLNNADVSNVEGYWTATSAPATPYSAWRITYNSMFSIGDFVKAERYGVRPVIEVLKTKLK